MSWMSLEPSSSDWCSPVVLVPKCDGTITFCIDFRQVNALSKVDPYPMPRIGNLVERLGKVHLHNRPFPGLLVSAPEGACKGGDCFLDALRPVPLLGNAVRPAVGASQFPEATGGCPQFYRSLPGWRGDLQQRRGGITCTTSSRSSDASGKQAWPSIQRSVPWEREKSVTWATWSAMASSARWFGAMII